jgi:polysulfide reductase-like protein
VTAEADGLRTYYDRPVLKAPTWRFYIPSYFFLGGTAAGSSLLAAGADAIGDARLGRAARVTALAALGGGAVALVADLGRPERFHHMLRVFRPSSPMNMGSWLLAAYGPAVGVAALSEVSGRAPVLGKVATWSAAALAPAIATYTGVLVADTAVPAWHGARKSLPGLFAAGAAASAGGVAVAIVPDAAPARRLALGGVAAEVAMFSLLEKSLPDDVGAAYTEGRAGRLRRAAMRLSLAGAGMCAAGSGRRAPGRLLTRLGGVAIALGAATERFAVIEAGRASAKDPRATIGPQRRTAAAANPEHA